MIEAYKNFGRAMLILRAVQHLQITGFAFSACIDFLCLFIARWVFERNTIYNRIKSGIYYFTLPPTYLFCL